MTRRTGIMSKMSVPTARPIAGEITRPGCVPSHLRHREHPKAGIEPKGEPSTLRSNVPVMQFKAGLTHKGNVIPPLNPVKHRPHTPPPGDP